MNDVLTATDVSFAYGPCPVLRGVSLSLRAGQVVGLIGPNGSGKSTLLGSLLGHHRATGHVAWEGRDLWDWNRRELAKRIAYLAQTPTWEQTQTVEECIQLGRAAYWGAFGIESERDGIVVNEVIASLEISALRTRAMHTLSGGQRQRVLIGRCLAQEPAALVLDEPDTFLDLRGLSELSKIIRTLARTQGIAILMASHDLNLAGGVADELILLNAGAVVARGSQATVLRDNVLSEAYGVPVECVAGRRGRVLVVPQD